MDVREAAWVLYGTDPSGFMAERSRIAAEARSSGDAALAKRLGGLRKPTVAAWVLNRAVRELPDLVEEIEQLGAALRAGADSGRDDAELRELGAERRRLVARVSREAAESAREHGAPVSDAVTRDLESTVQAALIDAGAEVALRSGLLVRPLAASGLEAVDVSDAVALPEVADEAREAQGAPDAEVIEFRPRGRRAAATPDGSEPTGRGEPTRRTDRTAGGRAATSASDRAAESTAKREAAERELYEARAELDEVRTGLRDLDGERERLEAEIDDLTEQLEGAREDLARVDRERGDLRRRRTRGERAVTDAERRLDRLS